MFVTYVTWEELQKSLTLNTAPEICLYWLFLVQLTTVYSLCVWCVLVTVAPTFDTTRDPTPFLWLFSRLEIFLSSSFSDLRNNKETMFTISILQKRNICRRMRNMRWRCLIWQPTEPQNCRRVLKKLGLIWSRTDHHSTSTVHSSTPLT